MSHGLIDFLDVQTRLSGAPNVCEENDRQAPLVLPAPQTHQLNAPTSLRPIQTQNDAIPSSIAIDPLPPMQAPTPPGDKPAELSCIEEHPSSAINPERPTSSPIVTQTASHPAVVPKTLPCWKWEDNSCSLDATLLISLRVLQEHMDKVAELTQTEPIFAVWLARVRAWRAKGNWQAYSGKDMNQARNSLRDLLKDGGLKSRSIAIGEASDIDELVPIFIPPKLTTSSLKTYFTCYAPIHSLPGNEKDDKTGFKQHRPCHLLLNAADGVNHSTQDMVKKFVITLFPLYIC